MARFTKDAIMKSFLKLLEKKSFEKITVKDIVEDCGVNRKTFYYYFADIYDLASQVFKSMILELAQNISPDMTVEETMEAFCDLLEKNKKTLNHSLVSLGEAEMKSFFYDVLCKAFELRVRLLAVDYNVENEDIETISRIITFGFVGSTIVWISSGFKPEEREKLKRLCVMLHGSIGLMLNNLEKYNKESK